MFELIPTILGAFGAATGAVGSAIGTAESIKAEDRNYEQRERLYDYQKKMQQTAWSREDNAVNRRMADLRRSGLNPNLAAGSSAGASGPVALKAPVRDTGSYERAGQIPGQIIERFANIAQTLAQTDYLNSQKDFQKIKNQIHGETIPEQISTIESGSKTAQSHSEIAAADSSVATALVDTHIDTAIENLATIAENRRQSVEMFKPRLDAIRNQNEISELDIKYAKKTINARIRGERANTRLTQKKLQQVTKLMRPLVGTAEAEQMLKELMVEDMSELNSAKKAKRQLFWNNVWKALDAIMPF